jgi:hypothetical protein
MLETTGSSETRVVTYQTIGRLDQWVPGGGLGVQTPPPPEIPKLGQIPRSVENKSVTT